MPQSSPPKEPERPAFEIFVDAENRDDASPDPMAGALAALDGGGEEATVDFSTIAALVDGDESVDSVSEHGGSVRR